MELWREIVMTGHWIYAGSVAQPVRLLRQNFDPDHEPEIDPDQPTLDETGVSYTVAFGSPSEGWWFENERATFATASEAIEDAERVAGRISWDTLAAPKRLSPDEIPSPGVGS
jgi:hypothetical protein